MLDRGTRQRIFFKKPSLPSARLGGTRQRIKKNFAECQIGGTRQRGDLTSRPSRPTHRTHAHTHARASATTSHASTAPPWPTPPEEEEKERRRGGEEEEGGREVGGGRRKEEEGGGGGGGTPAAVATSPALPHPSPCPPAPWPLHHRRPTTPTRYALPSSSS